MCPEQVDDLQSKVILIFYGNSRKRGLTTALTRITTLSNEAVKHFNDSDAFIYICRSR